MKKLTLLFITLVSVFMLGCGGEKPAQKAPEQAPQAAPAQTQKVEEKKDVENKPAEQPKKKKGKYADYQIPNRKGEGLHHFKENNK